ncbi:MAG: hypothetical protein INR71_10820 [Terriglobus roseus]|nr:hypothetical protein [Terriglobus roseus]
MLLLAALLAVENSSLGILPGPLPAANPCAIEPARQQMLPIASAHADAATS